LTPGNKPLTEAETAALTLKKPWPIADDPLLLESKAAVQQRSQLQLVTVATSTGEVESLEEELRDYVSRGIAPTDDMKSRVEKVVKNLQKLQEEAQKLIDAAPQTRTRITETPEEVLGSEESAELLKLVEGVSILSTSILNDCTTLLKKSERLKKLANAKPGFFASLFGSTTDQEIWLKAGKVMVDLDKSFREAKELSIDARFVEEDIEAERKAGEEPKGFLGNLKDISSNAGKLKERIDSLVIDAGNRGNDLGRAIQNATDEEKEDLESTLQSLQTNVGLAPNSLQTLLGVQALYRQLSHDDQKENSQEDRPKGLLRNTKALDAFKVELQKVAARESSILSSADLTGLAPNSAELKAGLRILRVHQKMLTTMSLKVEKGLKDLPKIQEGIQSGGTAIFSRAHETVVEGWRREAESYKTVLNETRLVLDRLRPTVHQAVESAESTITDPPESCDVPTILRFGMSATRQNEFILESEALEQELPTLANTDPLEKQRVALALVPLKPPVAERLTVVESYRKQIEVDWDTLSNRSARYQAGSLDLEDIKKGMLVLAQLRKKLKALQEHLQGYLKKWEGLQQKASA
jgi:hypothetical protein